MGGEPGTEISVPNYVVGEVLGSGGFGTVVRATHAVIGREVAIKVLHRRYSGDPAVVARFVAEARAVNQISHPGIVEIFDFGTLADGRSYCVMELLEGKTLRALLHERGHLALVEALPIFRGIAAALGAAHGVGIAHRDLKPENVFLTGNGRVKLIDFGLAKLSRTDAPVTETGAVFGTPLYMSPEQCRGREVDTQTDLYAFGALAYHVLVGEPPFAGDALELALHHLNDLPRAPSARRPELPARVDDAVLALLAKQPSARGTLERALALLSGEAESEIATADTVMSEPPLVRAAAVSTGAVGPRRRPVFLAAAAVVIAATAVLVGYRLWPRAWLPSRDRALAFVATNAGAADDAWLAPAVARLASRDMRARELRFRVVDDPAAANVVAHVRYTRDATGVVLAIDLTASGRVRAVGTYRGASVEAALESGLAAIATTVGDGQAERGPDAEEREAMAQIGAPSFADYREYTSIVDEQWGTEDTDAEATLLRIRALAARTPRWPHAQALTLLVGRGDTDVKSRIAALRAAIPDPTRDPTGFAILDAIDAQTMQEQEHVVEELEADAARAPTDVILAAMLYVKYLNLNRTDDAISTLRRLHERRPDLQFGSGLISSLRDAGRGEEVDALLQAWRARSPESEQAMLSTVMNDIDRGRVADAVQVAQAVILLHGGTPPRMRKLCDALIAADRLAEAAPIADRMLAGSAFERANAQARLGTIAVMQGRFAAGWESLRTLEDPGTPMFGGESTTLAMAKDFADALGLTDDARRIADKLEREYTAYGNTVPALVLHFERDLSRGCADVEAAVATVPDDGPARSTARRALLRVSAEKGCAPCRDVVSAGRAPSENDDRSLYQFAVCAESENQLQLAADAFTELRIVRLFDRAATGFAYRAILARYHLGRVFERMGKRAAAKAEYQDFLAHWGHADRPLPEVDEARAAVARL